MPVPVGDPPPGKGDDPLQRGEHLSSRIDHVAQAPIKLRIRLGPGREDAAHHRVSPLTEALRSRGRSRHRDPQPGGLAALLGEERLALQDLEVEVHRSVDQACDDDRDGQDRPGIDRPPAEGGRPGGLTALPGAVDPVCPGLDERRAPSQIAAWMAPGGEEAFIEDGGPRRTSSVMRVGSRFPITTVIVPDPSVGRAGVTVTVIRRESVADGSPSE